MSKEINYQSQYKQIKQQYDNLLQKNQNDVIRIKQKQKQLLDQIERLKRQKQEQRVRYEDMLNLLKRQMEQNANKIQKEGQLKVEVNPHKHLQQKIEELQMSARKLIDQNILLNSENTVLNQDLLDYTQKNEKMNIENQRLQQFIKSLQKDLETLRQEHLNANNTSTNDYSCQSEEAWISKQQFKELQERLNKSKKQYQHLKLISTEFKDKIRKSEDQTRYVMQRQKRSMNLLKKKQIEMNSLQMQMDKLKSSKIRRKKTENDDTCLRCNDFRREIDLLKGMVKSTQGMVRVRQIQVQKYKLHNNNEQKESKNNSRYIQKSPSLPPLKTIKEKR